MGLAISYKINKGLAPLYLTRHIPRRNEINPHLRHRNGNSPLMRTENTKTVLPVYYGQVLKNI